MRLLKLLLKTVPLLLLMPVHCAGAICRCIRINAFVSGFYKDAEHGIVTVNSNEACS